MRSNRAIALVLLVGGATIGCDGGDAELPLATWGDSQLSADEYDDELRFFLDEGETLATYNLDSTSFLERIVKYRILYEAASRTVTSLSTADEGRLQLYRDAVIRDRLISDAYGDAPLYTEEDVRTRFDERGIEERRVFHVQGPTEGSLARVRDAVRAGESFAGVLEEVRADDPSVQGGELGYIRAGTLPPELESVAWSLADNEVSDPFVSSGRSHVIWCAEIRSAPYENLRPAIVRELVTEERARRAQDFEKNLLIQGQFGVDSLSITVMAERIRAYRDSVPESGGPFPGFDEATSNRPMFMLSGQPFPVGRFVNEMGRFDPANWPPGVEGNQLAEVARRRALSQLLNSISLQHGLYEDDDIVALVERKRKELVVNTVLRDVLNGLDATDEDIRERIEEDGRQMPGPAAVAELKRQLTRVRQNQALEEYLAQITAGFDIQYYPERIPSGVPLEG